MKIKELISLLERCNPEANIEVAFELHGVARSLMPDDITAMTYGEEKYCVIDLGTF